MAGEQDLTTAAGPATSVPLVAGTLAAARAATTPDHPDADFAATNPAGKDLTPYVATSHWRPWPALGAVVGISAVAIAIGLGGGLLVLALAHEPAGMPRGAKIMVAMLTVQIIMITGTLIAARAKGDGLVTALALKAPAGGFWSYAGALVVMLAAVTAYTVATSLAFSHAPSEDLGDMIAIFRGAWWPMALTVIGVGAPLSEELMFRGFLQTVLVRTRLGYWGASLITTSIWTALHAGYSQRF